MQALTQAKPGETYTIKWLIAGHEIMEYLEAMNMTEGEEIYLLCGGKDSVIVINHGHKYAMSADVAFRIKV